MKDFSNKEWLDRAPYKPTFLSELAELILFLLVAIGFVLFLVVVTHV